MVHEERFPLPSARGRCRFGQRTFARSSGNERDAPTPAVRAKTIDRLKSTLSGHSVRRMNRAAFNAFLALGSPNWGLSLPPISSAATPKHLRESCPHERL